MQENTILHERVFDGRHFSYIIISSGPSMIFHYHSPCHLISVVHLSAFLVFFRHSWYQSAFFFAATFTTFSAIFSLFGLGTSRAILFSMFCFTSAFLIVGCTCPFFSCFLHHQIVVGRPSWTILQELRCILRIRLWPRFCVGSIRVDIPPTDVTRLTRLTASASLWDCDLDCYLVETFITDVLNSKTKTSYPRTHNQVSEWR